MCYNNKKDLGGYRMKEKSVFVYPEQRENGRIDVYLRNVNSYPYMWEIKVPEVWKIADTNWLEPALEDDDGNVWKLSYNSTLRRLEMYCAAYDRLLEVNYNVVDKKS